MKLLACLHDDFLGRSKKQKQAKKAKKAKMAKTGNKNGKNEHDLAKMSQKQILQGFPKLFMHFQECLKGFVESLM